MNKPFSIVIIFGVSSLLNATEQLTDAQKKFLHQLTAVKALTGAIPATIRAPNTGALKRAHPALAQKLTR